MLPLCPNDHDADNAGGHSDRDADNGACRPY
jgi:hypothetical protein